MEHFAVHDPIQGRKDLVAKYQKKLKSMPKIDGPDYILEPNPDAAALSKEQIKKLERDDNLKTHQDNRVWWVKQKQDNVEFAGMLEATDESLGRIRAKLDELGLSKIPSSSSLPIMAVCPLLTNIMGLIIMKNNLTVDSPLQICLCEALRDGITKAVLGYR